MSIADFHRHAYTHTSIHTHTHTAHTAVEREWEGRFVCWYVLYVCVGDQSPALDVLPQVECLRWCLLFYILEAGSLTNLELADGLAGWLPKSQSVGLCSLEILSVCHHSLHFFYVSSQNQTQVITSQVIFSALTFPPPPFFLVVSWDRDLCSQGWPCSLWLYSLRDGLQACTKTPSLY